MKRLLIIAGVLLALASCQKADIAPVTGTSFTVNIPQSGVRSRAVTGAFGTGTSVNRCILEIYRGDKLYDRIEKGISGGQIVFDDLRLVPQQTYDFIFWADCAVKEGDTFSDKHYTTTSLKEIRNKGEFTGNSDERDAFFAAKHIEVTGSVTEDITLKRPFGLLTVKANDLNSIPDETLKPTGYRVAFKGQPDTFNALTGEVSGSVEIAYTSTGFAKADDGTILMDFLWASETEAALNDFAITFLKDGTELSTNDKFKNIPIRRNHRTNVSGNLLTAKGTISANIAAKFDDPDYDEVLDVEGANNALLGGATDVVITETPTAPAEITIPNIYTDENAEISISIPETEHQITVKADEQTSGANAPAVVNLTVPSSESLVIDLPDSDVTINGGTHADVTAETENHVITISEETVIERLAVKGRSVTVDVYGTVETLAAETPKDVTFVLHVSTAEQLREFAGQVNAGNNFYDSVVLENDIDLENQEWTPIGKSGKAFSGNFDGKGHTISNLKINRGINTSASNADLGLFGYTTDGEIKNFTLHNASVKGGLDVGAIAGTPYTTKYSHITLTGKVTIHGYSYVGGMFGKNVYKSMDNLTIDAEEGSYVKAESGIYRTYIGGVIGFMGEGNITISNVTSDIDVTGSTCDVGGISGIAHYGNTFENCVCTGNVTLVNANDAGDQLEIGGIAGVWMNSTKGKVTFHNCRFDGTLSSALNGVDKSEEVAGNRITGRKYSPDSNDGELIIE